VVSKPSDACEIPETVDYPRFSGSRGCQASGARPLSHASGWCTGTSRAWLARS